LATTVPLNFDIYARDHASSTFNRFGHSVSASNDSVGKLKLGLGSLVRGFVALGVAYKTVDFFKQSISEASDLNESLNAVSVTYGKNAAGVKKLGEQAATSMGLSNNAFNSLAVQFSAFSSTIAGKGGDVVGTLKSITGRAADFASVMNIDVSEAARLFQSGLAGETEPLRKFGIDLSAAAVQAHAYKTGIAEAGATLTENEKVQARYSLLMRSTAKTQGDFKNTSDGLANSQRILSAEWDNMQAKVGTALLPVLAKLTTWGTTTLIPWLSQTYDWLSVKLGPVFSQVAGWFSDSSAKGGELSSAFANLVSAGKQLYAALYPIAVDIVQSIKRNWPEIKATIVSTLNAVAGVISSFAALATAVWHKFGRTIMSYVGNTFRNVATVIRGALQIIQGIIDVFTGVLTGDWSKAWQGVKEIFHGAATIIVGLARQLVNNIKTTLNALKAALGSAFSSAWDAAKRAVQNGIAKVSSFFKGLPGKIKGWVGDLSGVLFDAGVAAIQGLIDGITSKVDELGSKLSDVGGFIADHKGPIEKDRVLLKPAGIAIMEGLIAGITSKIQALKQTMQSVTDMVSGLFGNPLGGENVNTVADIFRQQRAETGDATRLRNDIKKLLHKGLDMRFITDMISTGNLTALHALAEAPASQVRRFERGERRLERVERRSSGMLNQGTRDRVADLKEQRREYERMLDRLEKAVKKGIDGAHIVLDGHGNAHLKIRTGGV
jgi:hypothetical protein